MKLVRFGMAISGVAMAILGTVTPTAGAGEAVPMIIGGGNASNAPWAARLFVNGQENCSATIIAPQYILTAKHCVAEQGTYTFRIGSLDQTSGGQTATGTTITRSNAADLAIVKLNRSVQAAYSPLGTASNVSNGKSVQVYGWGATCRDRPEIQCQSRLLKVANVTVTNTACRDAFQGIAVCARRGDGITAGGDSGGPMMGDGRQIGVASTSDRATTTAYTNITRYRDWIRSVAGV
jgi:secreted trypsin-like serine protease